MKLLCLLLLLAPPAAWAGKKSEAVAEARRLTGESEKLAQKGAWSGVERAYVQMLALERKGAPVTHETHVLGAHAAQNRGDPLTTLERLAAALEVEMRMETLTWKADLEATYSRFEVQVSNGYDGSLEVTALEPLFDPVHQQVLRSFEDQLAEQRYADVMLPLGRYKLGDQVTLESYGGEPQQVSVRPRGATIADPTVTDLSLIGASSTAAAATTGTAPRLSVQVGPEVEAKLWSKAAPGVQELAAQIAGVDQVVFVPAPDPWVFLSFDASALRSIGTEPDAIVAALRKAYRPTDAQLVVTANQIGLDAAVAPGTREVGLVEVPLGPAKIPVNAIARLRVGPKPGAPPAGLDVALTRDADASKVSAALIEAMQGPKYAALGLEITAGAQAP